MPITFAQPDPMVPSITAGAAAAEYAAKTFPTIAEIYANAAKLRAQGGGGGGRGGVVQTGGPIQVLPSSDGGAAYQVQSQANREQRSMDLAYEAEQDPVARHIQMQQDFKTKQQESAQKNQMEQLRLLNPNLANRGDGPTPQPQGPPPTVWTPDDQAQLNAAGQGVADLTRQVQAGAIQPEVYQMLKGPLDDQYQQLTAKQQAAQEQAEQQKNQSQLKQVMTQSALQSASGQALVRHAVGLQDIPGVPQGMLIPDGKGKLYDPTEHRAKMAVDVWKAQQAKVVPPETVAKMQQDAEIHEQKFEAGETAAYLRRRSEVEKLWDRQEEHEQKVFEKQNKDNPKAEWKHWPPEDRDKEIADMMRAKGQPGTLDEFIQKHKASRNPASAQAGQASQAAPSQAPAPPSQEDKRLYMEADPAKVDSFKSHISELPRSQTGQVDLESASTDQLRELNDYYSHPKAIGVTKEAADAARARINDVVQARHRKPLGDLPAPRDSSALPRAYDAVATIPNTDQDLGNGGHYVGGPPETQLGRRMREAIPSWDAVKGFFQSKNRLGIGQ